MYDGNGSPIGFMCCETADTEDEPHSFDVYYYEKNLQGDVIAVRDVTGAVRYSYYYNAWGELVYAYAHNGAENTTARYNTIFYRGYYFDSDLYLYYLTTRYYDAQIGRFISPDNVEIITASPMALTDKNLYAYCDNNPVMRVDHGGEFWGTVVLATFICSAIFNFASALIEEVYDENEGTNWGEVIVSTVINTIGDTAAVVTGPGTRPVIGMVVNAADTLVENLLNPSDRLKPTGEIVSETIMSGVMGFFGNLSFGAANISAEVLPIGKIWKGAALDSFSNFLSGFPKGSVQNCILRII